MTNDGFLSRLRSDPAGAGRSYYFRGILERKRLKLSRIYCSPVYHTLCNTISILKAKKVAVKGPISKMIKVKVIDVSVLRDFL